MGDQTDPRPLTAEEIEQMRPGIEHDAPIGSSWFGRLLASYDLVVAERDAARPETRAEGLRDTVEATVRSMDEWLASSDSGSPDDRAAIRVWTTALRAALAPE